MNRTQWQIRCAFNGFCKQVWKREAMNAHRDTKRQQSREVTFSTCHNRKKASFIPTTNILQMMKLNSLSLLREKR